MPGTLDIPYSTPYETGLKQLHAVGQKAETPDGSIFRYGQMGATLGVANKLYQSSIPIGNWTSILHTVALAVGDTEISFNDDGTAFVANEAAGGTIIAEETADLGHIYHVKSNIATASNETIMQLEDGVTVQAAVAVDTANVLTFIKNPWKDVIISPAAINSAPNAGIPRVVIAIAAFGWIQTRGPASCLIDSTTLAVLLGNNIRASEDDVGAVALVEETAGLSDYQNVGYAMETAPDGDFGHIFLQIE